VVVPRPPKSTPTSERFIAWHMMAVRMSPDAPTSDPAMTSTELSITKPAAAAASPE
jgi:hypothetical protein